MEKVAFIWGNLFVNWSAVILSLSCAAAVCIFLSVYLRESENHWAAFVTAPLAVLLSYAAARWLHWYCFTENYESLLSAMTKFSDGGFALMGVFAGCLAAALLTRVLFLHRNLPQMLDCMCIAGSAGIAVGRLASFYNSSDRGQIVQTVRSMPWVYPVVNSVSGAMEYRLATFLHQAMVAAVLFVILSLVCMLERKKHRRDGDVTLLFLLCYGTSEILLDSMRYDSMYFRSNGFVSIIQVLGAVALALVIVIFSVRMVKARGFRKGYLVLWAVMAALMGVAGYMEYHVQRHGNEAAFAYSVMGLCLALLVVLTLVIRGLSRRRTSQAGGRFAQ